MYTRKLHDLFCRNIDEIPVKLRTNLKAIIADLDLRLDEDQQEHLFDVGLALFHEEYLEAYRLSSTGEEPETELSAMQSCMVVEETTGYPVTGLFKEMVREILNCQDKSEEEVADILIRKYGAYPAQAILRINLREMAVPVNHVPDFGLAQSIQSIVDRHTLSPCS